MQRYASQPKLTMKTISGMDKLTYAYRKQDGAVLSAEDVADIMEHMQREKIEHPINSPEKLDKWLSENRSVDSQWKLFRAAQKQSEQRIAAAPELLAELIEAEDAIGDAMSFHDLEEFDRAQEILADAQNKLRALIARVTA